MFNPEYNICKIAGSSAGRLATFETKIKLQKAWLIRKYLSKK